MVKLDNILEGMGPKEVWEGIKNFGESIKGIGEDSWKAIKTIGDFLYYLMHPSLIFQGLWYYTKIYAFWICLFVALISIVLYALGFKKFAKYAPASISIYLLIEMIGSAF